MIDRVSIRNFKCHAHTSLDLGPFTILVGDNASGKTSVLQALWLLGAIAENPVGSLKEDWFPTEFARRGAHNVVLEASGVTQKQPWNGSIELSAKKTPPNTQPQWEAKLQGAAPPFQGQATLSNSGGSSGGAWDVFSAKLGRVTLYDFQAQKIAPAAYSNDPDVTVLPDGTNTAVALAAMKLADDESFARIETAMRRLIPSIEKIRIQRTVLRQVPGNPVGNRIHFDFRGASNVPAHAVSHGTLIALALLTVLYSPRRPAVVLLDELDHALHPRAQMELVTFLRTLVTLPDFGELQIVATTHSPYVLDMAEAPEVYAFAMRDDGTSASKRLSEHPDAAKMKGILGPGQLWSLDEERAWVLRNAS